jgi:hypothetical protein
LNFAGDSATMAAAVKPCGLWMLPLVSAQHQCPNLSPAIDTITCEKTSQDVHKFSKLQWCQGQGSEDTAKSCISKLHQAAAAHSRQVMLQLSSTLTKEILFVRVSCC